jgi:hypothetical protein
MGDDETQDPLRTPSTVKMTLQFERRYSTQGSRTPCHVSIGFFYKFYGISLADLQIDPQLESMIRPKARGLHSIWKMRFEIESHFPYGFFFKTMQVLLKTFMRRTRGRLGTTRGDFKTTQGSARVPSSLGMLQVFLRTFGLKYSGKPEDYLSRPSRLLETILLDYKVFGGLSYGPPWAHYLGGYQDRLLGGPLGLLGLCHTAPDGVRCKDYDG